MTPTSGVPGAPGAPAADTGRAARVVVAVALGVAFTGYAVGLAQVSSAARPAPAASAAAPAHADVAPLWSQLASARRGPNAALRTRVPDASRPGRDADPAPADADPAARQRSLARRAERRAYDGAPPVIPHPVDARTVTACLACHEHGLRLGELTASPMPHESYTSCTQCHAPVAPRELAQQATPWPASTFEGLAAPVTGERAWTGAPPVISHGTWMREDCLSCHGPNGANGLRSTHPWRQSCTQCHATRGRSP